jgi:stress response protein SCP2
MTLTFTKHGEHEIADLITAGGQPVGILEVILSWDQPTGGGFLGRLKPKTDVDVSAILFVDDEDVDYVSPKEHPTALGGRVHHHGDVKQGKGENAGEKISMHLNDIRTDDADITAIALTASCATGSFDRIAGAACRFYDATRPEREPLGVVRFSVSADHAGSLLGVVRKTDLGWTFAKTKAYGAGGNWRTLANLARGHVR